MKEITDSALLNKLNSENYSTDNLRSVDDADLLKKLNGKDFHEDFKPALWEKIGPDILAGLAQMGQGIINTPSNIANYAASKGIIKPETAKKLYRQDYDFASMLKLPDTPTDKLIQGIAQYSPALVSPGVSLGVAGKALKSVPYAGKIAEKIISNAIPVSGFSATQSIQPEESAIGAAKGSAPFSALSSVASSANPYARLLARLGIGSLGAYGGHEVAKTIAPESSLADAIATTLGGGLGLIGKTPTRMAKEDILKGVNPENISDKLEASRRLGLSYLTPAEASGNQLTAAIQGAAGKTETGSQLLYGKGKERLASEKNAINDLYHTIFDKEKLNPDVDKLYSEAYQKTIPQDALSELKNNEVFKAAVKNMNSKPAFRESLKNVPENSIGYLDTVKQSIDDMIEGAPKKEAKILEKTKKELLNNMDYISPEYSEARSLAERRIARNKIETSLNDSEVKGTSFYNKVLKNDKQFDKLLHSLRNVPQAQQKLKDMRLVFSDLINPPSVRTSAGAARSGMNQERNSKLAMLNYVKDKLSNGKYDKAAIELITRPDWDKEFSTIKNISNTQRRVSQLSNLLSKISGTLSSINPDRKLLQLDLNNYAGVENGA